MRGTIRLFSFGLILLLTAFTGVEVWEERDLAIEQARSNSWNLAQVMEQQARQIFREARLNLDLFERWRAIGGDPQGSAPPMLKERIAATPEILNLFVLSEEGRVRYEFKPLAIERLPPQFLDRHRDAVNEPLVISGPFRGADGRSWSIFVSKRLERPSGSFGGLAGIEFDLGFFIDRFAKLDLGPDGTVALWSDEGRLLARHPHRDRLVGMSVADGPLFRRIKAGSTADSFIPLSPLDNIERLLTYRLVEGFPAVVTVAISTDHILDDWRGQSLRDGGYLAASVAAILFLSEMLTRHVRRREASEARLQDIADAASDWFWETDRDHRFTWFSDSTVSRTTRITRSAIGRTRRDLIEAGTIKADLESPEWREHFATLEARRPFRNLTYEIQVGDHVRVYSIHGKPIFGPGNEFMGYRGAGTDITEIRRMEEALRQSEAESRKIVATTQEGYWRIDFATKLTTDVNDALLKMLGYSRSEMIGRSPLDFVDEANAEIFRGQFKVAEARESRTYEISLRRKDGEAVHCLFNATALKDSKGRNIAAFSFITDITEQKKLEARLRELATIDPLTGLFNRRHFLEQADREMARALRFGQPLSALLLDLDHFKAINDGHGHQIGDKVLRAFADAGRQTLREIDVFGRLGGEEFAVVLPQTEIEAAFQAAERLRLAVMAIRVPSGERSVSPSVSIGIGTLLGPQDTMEALLSRADAALYQAKRLGRNRCATQPMLAAAPASADAPKS